MGFPTFCCLLFSKSSLALATLSSRATFGSVVAEEEEAEEVAPSTGCSDDVEGLVTVVEVAVWLFSLVDGVASAAAVQVSSVTLFYLPRSGKVMQKCR